MARFVFMMLDGAGAGELPDAADYGDVGSNTLGNVASVMDLSLPNLRGLGLGNVIPLRNVPPVDTPQALVGRLAPKSAGKDTTVGHWEHMGLVTPRPFPTYPEGFPEEILRPFRKKIGRGILGNKPASGTAIIDELGAEHLQTGRPIVYTSADSVFQIAAHVEAVPLEQLYEWCQVARDILQGDHAMARVIARPFTGSAGAFTRTKDRRDFSLEPPAPLYLDLLCEAGVPVMALGKVSEIFLGRGVTSKIKIGSNAENLALLLGLLRGTSEAGSFTRGLLFTNLVDFDMVWGHRNDPDGFAAGLQAVDAALPDILATLGPQDRLVITADHGVDPTTSGTDHSREYVPLLYYPRPDGARDAVFEGGFADTGATAYAHLTGRMPTLAGRSLDSGEPERGWRHYPGSVPSPGGTGLPWPTKVTVGAATEAAAWLQERCGDAPSTAVVLGSGLSTALRGAHGRPAGGSWPASYDQVPGWKTGSVVGHPGILEVVGSGAERLALLAGRLHGYEGYDLGELQLGVRTMAAWGVKRLVLTCAAGGLSPAASPGTVVAVRQVLDVQHSDPQAIPMRLEGTSAFLLDRLAADRRVAGFVRPGVYAAVPGPQYETPAENDLLRSLGADCVGMSVAAELHAAREVGLDVAVFALVANAGAASHEEVVAAAELRGERLVEVVTAGLSAWEGR